MAEERFAAGYDLSEVQTALNALEGATWSRVFTDVSLATEAHTPALDMTTLFAGAESPAEWAAARRERPACADGRDG